MKTEKLKAIWQLPPLPLPPLGCAKPRERLYNLPFFCYFEASTLRTKNLNSLIVLFIEPFLLRISLIFNPWEYERALPVLIKRRWNVYSCDFTFENIR